MFCWGNTQYGQLGLGGIEEDTVPIPVYNKYLGDKRLKEIACGYNHSVYLLNDGSVYTSGNNDYNQLGHDGPRKKPGNLI
jgi:E3 ubiquitin-protein ligase HERC4